MFHMIDHGRLAVMAHGSAATQAEILADFRRTNAQDGALLRQAAGGDDFTQISILAHRIKGASVMLGAVQFAEACSLVSMAGRACDRQEVEAALVFFERAMAQLDVYLAGLCNGTALAPVPLPSAGALPEHAMLCSNLRFLVVEDHAFQRDLIMRFLRRLGALEVRGLGDGGAALEALNTGTADIMVLDLSMPGMDGMDLMRVLSGTGHRISLILNSALSPSQMASFIQTAKTYRVNLLGAVSKPLTESCLAPLIAKYRAGRIEPTGHEADTVALIETGKQ
jgi:CheY-like chemotaxis protein/HPt (histidine-containing phosphotransfer) domain-containing protein